MDDKELMDLLAARDGARRAVAARKAQLAEAQQQLDRATMMLIFHALRKKG
ncbi:hypothetical protein SEA_PETTERN_81 [Mycobacterium phage PetterN]|uniref:Uncharacterized protein n=1 Tax=Mycobacterium phage Scorpia TaxID=2517968 RepID=A0A482J8T4_9CAUD|nr:hypothetical protein KIP49_gp16 [Mycobacterium phage Scorpia]QBP29075.1 hypothetical protein SEA_SCORPIA_76 [Mycobacterium phage Scorpia]QGJ97125.1 hypothetical protein SEA_PETTERN_81 [Mycobacterium phage PetterN]